MRAVRSHPAASSPPVGASPGDAFDAARARQGSIAYHILFAGGLLIFLLSLILGVPPFTWSQDLVNRAIGSDSVTLAGLPVVAVLLWAPRSLLNRLPRRPDRSFLCGMQDAVDPKRNPNWRARLPSPAQQARTLLTSIRVTLAVALLFAILGVVAYHIVGRAPSDAGLPLPRLTVDDLARLRGQGLPHHARIVGVTPDYERIWVHRWSNRQTRYQDVYLPLRAADRPIAAPVVAIELASYPGGGAGIEADPPVPPIEGALSHARLPAWMRWRMQEAGFTPADDAVLIRRERLDGRNPGADGLEAGLALALGLFLAVSALGLALLWTIIRRRLLRSIGAVSDRSGA